ncbi:MAG: AAA family ATPase [Gammaproteobacteria bacterium]|nr:AAA family ATPase [Gammaproteobacteria bacterium]
MEGLDWITIEGFKSIRKIERLPLDSINVLVGPNGCGKSNFISTFSFLHAIRGGGLRNYVGRAGGADQILHFGSKTTTGLMIHLSFANEKNQYKIELAADDSDNLFPVSETTYFWRKDKYPEPYSSGLSPSNGEAGISSRKLHQDVPRYVAGCLDSWRLYHFHDTSSTSPMKKRADLNDNRHLRPDASNLSSYLYYLREAHEDSYDLIRRTTRLVAPFFDDFLLEPLELDSDSLLLEWRHQKSDAYFGPSALSDGTLRFIALATLLLQPDDLRPSVVLLDEPEIGLHPYAITILASLIQQAATATQIVVATQSPLLLDHFEPENILVANRREGGTELTRLDRETLKDWLEDYSLGQLWEKNEFGGRPSPE